MSVSFDSRADRYDELRPLDEHWWFAFDALVRLGDLRGQRVLELACGTGQLSRALAEREHARVWAVDASTAMVARAKELGVNARVARGESLPFKPGWFDRVVVRMAVHLLDRPRAFAEAARVLAPGGRLVIATSDTRFEDNWFAPYFPSVPEIERARFPGENELRAELAAAGFSETSFERHDRTKRVAREHALEVIRGKAYSTFDLLPPGEYEAGVARAEAELPAILEYDYHWLFAVAVRPS